MSELLYLVGFSNAGKDYIAKTQWANFTNVKLTESFKRVFADDHSIQYEACNDKTLRNTKLSRGPMAGLTLSEAMVTCYNQSLSGIGYGHKFKYLTLTSTLQKLAELASSRTPIAITDLRKPTELKVLQAFSEVMRYDTRMIVVSSNRSTPKASDSSLTDNINLYTCLTGKPVEYCQNDRNRGDSLPS